MGQNLSDPITTKVSAQDQDYRLCYASSSMQGYRTSMEDAHTHILKLPGFNKRYSFFGVYDGHGGDTAAHYCARHLHEVIAKQDEFASENFVEAFKKGYLAGDEALKVGTDNGSIQRHISGCTAVSALVTENWKLYVSNAGDSRAVLSSSGKAIPMSTDHKPTNNDESERIWNAGSFVELGRVSGALALSRAIGDFSFKSNADLPPEKQAVTSLPDVIERQLTPNDQFIVLACDGIWDCLTNQGVTNFVLQHLSKESPETNLKDICESMLTFCLEQSQTSEPGGPGWDNMTLIIVAFIGVGDDVVAVSSESEEFESEKAKAAYIKWVDSVEANLKQNGIDRKTLEIETVAQQPSIFAQP